MTAPDLRAVRAAVRAGVGISVLPRYLVQDDILDGRLDERGREVDVTPNRFHLAVRDDGPRGRSLARWLLAQSDELQRQL